MGWIRQVVIANLGMISAGFCYGWSPFFLDDGQVEGYAALIDKENLAVVFTLIMGSFVGSLLAFLVTSYIGRKSGMVLSTMPLIAGWLTIACGTQIQDVCIGRILCGIGVGTLFTVMPVYIPEITPSQYRGLTGASIIFTVKLGTIAALVIDTYMFIMVLFSLAVVVPIIFGLFLIRSVDSPYFLMLRSDVVKATRSLEKLRKIDEIDEEMTIIRNAVADDLKVNKTCCHVFFAKTNRNAIYITAGLVIVQYFTGGLAMHTYSKMIFNKEHTFDDGQLMLLLTSAELVGLSITMILVDRHGRRLMLLISTCIGIICNLIMMIYVYLLEADHTMLQINWLIWWTVFIFAISLGLGPSVIPTILIGELFSTSGRPVASAIFRMIGDLCIFVNLWYFRTYAEYASPFTIFFIFLSCGVVSMMHVVFFVPETKQMTLEELQNMMTRGQAHEKRIAYENENCTKARY